MTAEPRYTARAIRKLRWYFRIGGLILVASGVGVFLSAIAEQGLEAGAMVAVGVGAFLFSFAHPGERGTDKARDHSIGSDD
jgi:hypothetical protein